MTIDPTQSGTLTAGTPVGGKAASAEAPNSSTPTGPGLCATWPRTHTDHLRRYWVWDTSLDCYRHDEQAGTILCLPETLADRQIAARATLPVNVFEWVFAHSRATGLARQVLLNLAWDEDADLATDLEPAPWPGYLWLWLHIDDEPGDTDGTPFTEPIADAVVELIALGELLLITTPVLPVPVPDDAPALPTGVDLSRYCPDVAYTLPAYQKWLTEHEVAW